MSNHYAEAIRMNYALGQTGVRDDKIVSELMARYPSVFCEIVKSLIPKTETFEEQVARAVKKVYNTPNNQGIPSPKVAAIKKYRELTNSGLYDAKIYVEKLCEGADHV